MFKRLDKPTNDVETIEYFGKRGVQSVPHTIQKMIKINHRLNFKT